MKTDLFEVQGLCVDVRYLVLGPIQNNTYLRAGDRCTRVLQASSG